MTKLPAGEYYIGDPCYVVENWDDYLGAFWATTDRGARGGMFDFDGYTCAAFYTMYGDGAYDFEGVALGVDSGTIGVIPLVLVTRGAAEDAGTTIKFTESFTCHEENGRLHFGDHVINTAEEDDDEEEKYGS
jgi:hypothetical protein